MYNNHQDRNQNAKHMNLYNDQQQIYVIQALEGRINGYYGDT